MPRTSVHLSKEAKQKLEELSVKNGGNISKTVEELVMKAGSELPERDSKTEGTLRRLRVIENDTNKRVQVLTELLNSFLNTFGTYSAEDFSLSSDSPHPWLTFAEQGITQKIEQLQQEKFMRGGK